MTAINKLIVDKALSASKELSSELREATFIPIFGNDISCIKDQTFIDCRNMVITKIPEHISALEDGVFMNCQKIEKFSLLHISCIGRQLFSGCTNLSAFEFTENNLSIGQYAFDKTALSVVKLPDAMDKIDQYAFTNCSSLVSASGNNVISALHRAFWICPQLSAIDFPKLNYAGGAIVYDCISLSTIKLPELSVIDSTYGLAYNCSALTGVAVPKLSSIKNNSNSFLINCANVISVYINNDVLHSINNGQIVTATSSDNEWKWISPKIDHIDNINVTSLPTGEYTKFIKHISCVNVVSCEDLDFSKNENLQYVNLPRLSSANFVFSNCKNLLSLDFSSTKQLFYNYNENQPLANCEKLSSIILPDDMVFIGGSNTSHNCFDDTEIFKKQVKEEKQVFELNNGIYCVKVIDQDMQTYESQTVRLIASYAWYDNYNLTAINCPNCKYVNNDAFYASAIRNAKLDNVEIIGEEAFSSEYLSSIICPKVKILSNYAICYTNLSSINIPIVENLNDQAISENYSLLSVIMSALTEVPETNGDPLYNLHPDYKVYVNANIRDEMANTGWWKNIADKIIAL